VLIDVIELTFFQLSEIVWCISEVAGLYKNHLLDAKWYMLIYLFCLTSVHFSSFMYVFSFSFAA